MKTYTMTEAAQKAEISEATACRYAKQFGIGSWFGKQRVFSDVDIRKLKEIRSGKKPGNPNFQKK